MAVDVCPTCRGNLTTGRIPPHPWCATCAGGKTSAVDMVRRLMRDLGIDRSHVLTLRDADPLAHAGNVSDSGSNADSEA